MPSEKLSERLLAHNLITPEQATQINAQQNKDRFPVKTEILFLLFTGVFLFCGGAGLIVYKNINSLSHLAILSGILLLTGLCFYYAHKNLPPFSWQKTSSDKPIADHALLCGNMLAGIFIAYTQNQYAVFGPYNDLATLSASMIYFFFAYRYDHQGVLSLAIAALCAFIGFSISPYGIFRNHILPAGTLAYYAIATGTALLLWRTYTIKQGFKSHFRFTFENFALHIIAIAGIANLLRPFWYPALICLVAAFLFYYRLTSGNRSLQMFTFLLIYIYITATVLVGKFVSTLDLDRSAIYLSPVYFALLIYSFIRNIKTFKNSGV